MIQKECKATGSQNQFGTELNCIFQETLRRVMKHVQHFMQVCRIKLAVESTDGLILVRSKDILMNE
jgi:hypothetical protein